MIDSNKDYKSISKIHIDLVERLEKYTPTVRKLQLKEEVIKDKLANGIPYLEAEEDKLDLQYAVLQFKELCQWIGLGDARSQFKKMRKKATDEEVENLLRAWLKGDGQQADQFASLYNVPLDVLYIQLRYSLLPTLYEYAKEFYDQKLFNGEDWMKDYCPVCGDQHGLAEFRGTERFRHFRCLSCAGDWIYWRIACPYCDNKDHNKLETLFIEEEKGSYQLDVCQECHGYVKGINKLDKSTPMFLLLDDFLTLHLDMLAIEKGYHKDSLSAKNLQ